MLRHWLTFELLIEEADSDEQLVESWVDAFAVSPRMPCRIETLSGRELIAAQALSSKVTHRITTRYRDGFDAKMRAVHPNGTTYNIEAVLHDDESGIRWTRLLCSSGLNAGGTAT